LGQTSPLTKRFAAAIVLGFAIRAVALPLPGTHDVAVWKIWSYGASHDRIGRLYGVGGTPPERRVVTMHGAGTTVDYPPLALAELGAAGRVYRWLNRGDYPDGTALIVALKIPLLIADTAMLALLAFGLVPLVGATRARRGALAYWLNPAILLDGAFLGYLDPLFIAPACASFVAVALGAPFIAGALAAAACLTKPQAILLIPAVAFAAWCTPRVPQGLTPHASRHALARAAAGGAVTLAAGISPVLIAGALPNFLQAMGRLGQHDMLSANACNVWWIVGYVLRAYYSMHDMGAWAAFTAPAKILGISRVVELGYPNPRTIGLILAGASTAWAVWTARRRRDIWIAVALAAFVTHAYATLAAQVHENHLFAAVPLLGLAAVGRPRLVPAFALVSAIFALNLNLFYGISEDIGYALPRTATVIDATVLLAAVNCGALAWHAAVFSRECSTEAERRPAPAPA
jgi:hypothetical protein